MLHFIDYIILILLFSCIGLGFKLIREARVLKADYEKAKDKYKKIDKIASETLLTMEKAILAWQETENKIRSLVAEGHDLEEDLEFFVNRAEESITALEGFVKVENELKSLLRSVVEQDKRDFGYSKNFDKALDYNAEGETQFKDLIKNQRTTREYEKNTRSANSPNQQEKKPYKLSDLLRKSTVD